MSDIAALAGASSAYIQELQFTAAETAAYQAELLQAETIQATYVLTSATDAAATKAAYARAAEDRVEIAAANAANTAAVAAEEAKTQALAAQSAEALISSEFHHHFHPGGPGPADELSALTQPETPVPPGTNGLDTIA